MTYKSGGTIINILIIFDNILLIIIWFMQMM